jgi:hypothetical protein
MISVGERIGRAGQFWSERGVALVNSLVRDQNYSEFDAVREVIFNYFLLPVNHPRSDTFFQNYGYGKTSNFDFNMEVAEVIADLVAKDCVNGHRSTTTLDRAAA